VSKEESVERLSVGEAAEALGVTRDAIHKRIRRESIRYERGEDGRFYVYVDTSTSGLDTSVDESKDESKVEYLERLIEDQRDQIAYLRSELGRRAETHLEESRRKDSIIAALTQRIPEIEASPEPSESPQAATEGEDGAKPRPEPQSGTSRPWWRRMFGG
jgi:predicted DNA-binding protein YlxM (UPF0122 family)